MLLIGRPWAFRTAPLQRAFAEAAREAGLRLHDHNRKGEKGFFYLAPGFTTTPEGEAMRTFFRAQGNEATAAHFHDSSMEFVQRLGGGPALPRHRAAAVRRRAGGGALRAGRPDGLPRL